MVNSILPGDRLAMYNNCVDILQAVMTFLPLANKDRVAIFSGKHTVYSIKSICYNGRWLRTIWTSIFSKNWSITTVKYNFDCMYVFSFID